MFEAKDSAREAAPSNAAARHNSFDPLALAKCSFDFIASITPKPPALPNLDNLPGVSKASMQSIRKESTGLHFTIWHGLQDCISIMWRQNKLLFAGTCAATALSAAIPIAATKLNSYVPDLLSGSTEKSGMFIEGIKWLAEKYNQIVPAGFDLNSGVAMAFVATTIVGVFYAKAGLANGIAKVTGDMFSPSVERAIRIQHSKLIESLPYEEMLSAENKDRSSIISQGLWAYRNFFNSSLSACTNSIALVSTACAFFAMEGTGYLGLGLIISAVPVFLSGAMRNMEKLWLDRKLTYQNREAVSGKMAISDANSVAMFKHFRSNEQMRERFSNDDVRQNSHEAIAQKRRLWSDCLITGNRVIASTLGAFVALQFYIPGHPVSSAMYALGMVGLFQGSLYGLARESTELLNLAAQINPFYKLKNEIAQHPVQEQKSLPAECLSQTPSIEIKGLTKQFPTLNDDGTQSLGKVVLDIPNLRIESGQTIGICGRIESGKSVFAQLLSGRLVPTTGSITWTFPNGERFDTADIVSNDLEQVTMRLQQGGYSFERLTIREILELAINKNPNSRFNIQGILDSANLAAVIESAPDGLDTRIGYGWVKGWIPSGGKGHVINLAQALLSDCPIILLDEPTGDLDTVQKRNFSDVIIPLLKSFKKTVVVVSHTFGDLAYSDRVLVFKEGKIVDDDTPQNLAKRPGYYSAGSLEEINRALSPYQKRMVQKDDGSIHFEDVEPA